MYLSQDAEMVASNCLFNGTLFRNAVERVAEHTRADELLKPDAGGIFPLTAIQNPLRGVSPIFWRYSTIPFTPHRK